MKLPYSNPAQDLLLGEIRAEMSRQRPRITQQMIADATDNHPTTVSRWFSGETAMRVTDLLRICDRLGLTISELTRRAEAAGQSASDGAA